MQFDQCSFYSFNIFEACVLTLPNQKDLLLRQTPRNTWYNEIRLCILDVETILGSRVNQLEVPIILNGEDLVESHMDIIILQDR